MERITPADATTAVEDRSGSARIFVASTRPTVTGLVEAIDAAIHEGLAGTRDQVWAASRLLTDLGVLARKYGEQGIPLIGTLEQTERSSLAEISERLHSELDRRTSPDPGQVDGRDVLALVEALAHARALARQDAPQQLAPAQGYGEAAVWQACSEAGIPTTAADRVLAILKEGE